MSWAAPLACATAGSPWRGRGGCPTHTRARRMAYDAARGSAAERGYGSTAWKRLRLEVLARDPLCRLCGLEVSVVADHIVARQDGGPDTLENLQGLGRRCAAIKRAAETRARRERGYAGRDLSRVRQARPVPPRIRICGQLSERGGG
jgi:5-methylcytosine-specific restriction endonuclease McrA